MKLHTPVNQTCLNELCCCFLASFNVMTQIPSYCCTCWLTRWQAKQFSVLHVLHCKWSRWQMATLDATWWMLRTRPSCPLYLTRRTRPSCIVHRWTIDTTVVSIVHFFPFADFLPVCWQECDSKFVLYRWKRVFCGIYEKKGLGLLGA